MVSSCSALPDPKPQNGMLQISNLLCAGYIAEYYNKNIGLPDQNRDSYYLFINSMGDLRLPDTSMQSPKVITIYHPYCFLHVYI